MRCYPGDVVKWQEWGHWSPCSTSCRQGSKVRARACNKPAIGGKKQCPGNSSNFDACTASECQVDCKIGMWLPWGKCSRTCGGGVKIRTRNVFQEVKHGGDPCQDREEIMVCNSVECKVDREVGMWTVDTLGKYS